MMNICKIFWQWLMFFALPMCFDGGDSSSSSSTTTNNLTKTVTKPQTMGGTDNGAIAINADGSAISLMTSDQGAINAAKELGNTAITETSKNTTKLLDAASALNAAGFDMLKANGNWAQHLIDSASAQNQAAITTVASVVSKPLDMNDPKHLLVAVGMIVAAVVAVMALKKG